MGNDMEINKEGKKQEDERQEGEKKYDYTGEAGPIRRFLWFCAGADSQLMQRCPHSERVKEEGIGGVVLATAVLAFLSGSYALDFVFDNIFWGCPR